MATHSYSGQVYLLGNAIVGPLFIVLYLNKQKEIIDSFITQKLENQVDADANFAKIFQ